MNPTTIMLITGQSEQTIEKTLAMDLDQYNPLVEWFSKQKNMKVKRLEAFKRRRKRYMI